MDLTSLVEIQFNNLDRYVKRVCLEQYPFAASLTANKALTYSKSKVIDAMAFDIKGGATRFTKQGLKIYPTSKGKLKGALVFKADRSYMRELMDGGVKKPRAGSKTIAEPNMKPDSAVKLNKYGNYPRNYLQNAMRQANITWSDVRSRKQHIGINGYQLKKLKEKKHLTGLWQWRGTGKERRPHLLVVFKTERDQRQTFDAKSIASGNFIDFYQRNFSRYYNQALLGAR